MNNGILKELLSRVYADGEIGADALIEKFGNLIGAFEADVESLSEALSGDLHAAVYIKLCAAVISRRGCDAFKLGRRHTEEEICEYLTYLFFGLSDETVYLLSLDGEGRVTASDKVGDGTVNVSNILPRKVLDLARKRGARSVIIAHNHPGGYAKPSDDDTSATAFLSSLLISSGVGLEAHYVVAGNECARVPAVGNSDSERII